MQVVKVSGDDLLPLLTAENEQGVTELQVEEAGMQAEEDAENWRRQGGRGCRGKDISAVSRYKCVHLYTPSLSSPSHVPAAFLYVTLHSAGRQSHVKSLANALPGTHTRLHNIPEKIPAVMSET